MRRISSPVLCAALLVGCPTSSSTSVPSAPASDPEPSGGGETTSTDVRERGELNRAGLVAAGDYLFELPADSGAIERRTGRLESFDANELEVTVDGRRIHTTREATWPMLCLTSPLQYGDGALRVELQVGAPVYVIASGGSNARVGPVPVVAHGRAIDRSLLALEGCTDETAPAAAHVATLGPSDSACLFADPDPADESEGLTIPSGAPLEEIERDDEWAHVRVFRPGGVLEGWIDASLIETGTFDGTPDWTASSLRPQRCSFPGRPPSSEEPRAWVERSVEGLPAPSTAPYQAVLRESDPRVRACYAELPAEQRPARASRVDIRLSVDGDGQVSSAAVVRRENAPEALARCIIERARRVRFPAPRTELVLRHSYVFDAPVVEAPVGEDEEDDEL